MNEASDLPGARAKLGSIAAELGQCFLERTEVIEGALAALLSGQHVLLVGPPGAAKSMLADELCRRIVGAQYFQWLLTKFTTPDELFGSVSLRALEQDDYRRVTANKLPEAHIAFLDEVFKASSSILNALLTLLNERRFHNGREILEVPLLTVFGAANELPDDDELQAVYDRFLVRFLVDYITEDWRFLRMLRAERPRERTQLSLAELELLSAAVRQVAIPDGVLRSLVELRRLLATRELRPSDRRFRQSLDWMRALAFLRGREQVTDAELLFLEHVLWRDPADRQVVRDVLRELISGYDERVQELLFQSRELAEYAQRGWESPELRTRARIEVESKLRRILAQLDGIEREAADAGRGLERSGVVRSEVEALRERISRFS